LPIFMHTGQKEEKVELSGVYTCSECGEVVRFGRGELFTPCPRCYNEAGWQLIRKVWGEA
jgi:hypothetical protein